MRAAGCETVVDSGTIAAVGITEVVKHVATIYREFFRVVSIARTRRPDVAVLFDFSDFYLLLAGKGDRLGGAVGVFVFHPLLGWGERRSLRRTQGVGVRW